MSLNHLRFDAFDYPHSSRQPQGIHLPPPPSHVIYDASMLRWVTLSVETLHAPHLNTQPYHSSMWRVCVCVWERVCAFEFELRLRLMVAKRHAKAAANCSTYFIIIRVPCATCVHASQLQLKFFFEILKNILRLHLLEKHNASHSD